MLTCPIFTTLARAASVVLLFALAGCSTNHLAGEPVSWGTVTATNGFPAVQRNYAKYILAAESRLFPADIISTDKGARLELLLNDGTRVALGPNAQIVLQEYTPGTRLTINLSRGEAYLSVPAGSSINIGSSVANLTLTGGTGFALLKSNTLDVALTEAGTLNVSNDDGAVTINNSGMGTQVIPGSAPQPVFPWSPRRLERTGASIAIQPAPQ